MGATMGATDHNLTTCAGLGCIVISDTYPSSKDRLPPESVAQQRVNAKCGTYPDAHCGFTKVGSFLTMSTTDAKA